MTPRLWTDVEIERLRQVNGSISSNVLAREFRCCRWTVLQKERSMGISRVKPEPQPRKPDSRSLYRPTSAFPRDDRPLPAGHPESWGLLTRGTLLDGTPWPNQPEPIAASAEFDRLARHINQARINSGRSQAECVAYGFASDYGYDAAELLAQSEKVAPLQWAGG